MGAIIDENKVQPYFQILINIKKSLLFGFIYYDSKQFFKDTIRYQNINHENEKKICMYINDNICLSFLCVRE